MEERSPTVAEVLSVIEAWAPREIAWQKDNVGHLVGRRGVKVRRILVALDVTDEVIAEARHIGAQLLVTHHPLIFQPILSVTDQSRVGRLLLRLTESNIALIVAHTNLDFSKDGVSMALARALGLQELRFLHTEQGKLEKIAVFVPKDHVDTVSEAMARAGAGIIGEYSNCSFRVEGTGTFKPSERAHPFVGSPGTLEHVDEIRLEMILPSWKRIDVIEAMKAVHPYEEVAYDVYPLVNADPNYGAGVIGRLPKPVRAESFLRHIRRQLHVEHLRYVKGKSSTIQSVAVCGGACSDLIKTAIQQNADALVTADISYHTFQEAEGSIFLVDAGHFETEAVVVSPFALRLERELKQQGFSVSVIVSKEMKNPVQWL